MQYLVRYRAADGAERFEEVATLEGAIAMVERLRNEEGVSDTRVYRHVPLEVRTYYKVVPREEQAAGGTQTRPAAPDADDAPPGAMPLSGARPSARPAGEDKPDRGEDAEAAEDRRSLFSRS